MIKVVLGAVLILAGALGAATASNLKPLDPAALQHAVDTMGRELMLPGALVLLRTPAGDFAYGYGATSFGGSTTPRGDTRFRIASNTKTMTAAATILLAKDGKLQLADPISKYVQGVPNGDDITIELLLRMRSGLYNYTMAPEIAASLDTDPARAWMPEQLLALAFARPPNFAPDAAFEYCNTNYLLLGLVIEKIEGKPLPQVLHDRLFTPLGMTNTLLPAADDIAIPAPFTRGYIYGGAEYALTDEPYPADLQATARSGALRPLDATDENPSYAQAAGGAISTADDLAIWMDALVGGKVFGPEWHDRWLGGLQAEDPAAADGPKYGYGISQISWGPNRMYFHGGEMPGYNSFMGHDPDNDLTLIVWSNLTVSLDGQPTANSLMLQMLDRLYVVSSLR